MKREELESRLLASGAEKANSAHHRLPQFYLRGWVGKDGKLRLLDPGSAKSQLKPAKKVFAEKGYYTVRVSEEGGPNALVEELYTSIENEAAPVHRRLLAGDSPAALSPEERMHYATFLAAAVDCEGRQGHSRAGIHE